MSTTASPERSFYLPYTQPALRDLAFLLTAPAPWDSGSNLAPQRLLGPDGLALLAALEQTRTALCLAGGPAQRRLATMPNAAGLLVSPPHIELVAANLRCAMPVAARW
jgi:hypothetical protein